MRRWLVESLKDEQYWRAFNVHPDAAYLCMFHLGPPGIAMAYFYSGMYVLIEGWRALRCSDPVIDALLESPLVGVLRRFRNATVHFQADFVSDKWRGFIDADEESAVWIRELRNAFSEFFLRESTWADLKLVIPEELDRQITGKPLDEALALAAKWIAKRRTP